MKDTLSRDDIQRVRDSADLVEVIGRSVTLKKSGQEHRGQSPFGGGKLAVNGPKRRWFCYATNTNGDVFDFVMRREGKSFPEAVRHVAEICGIRL